MKVIITGGSGYLGSVFTDVFLKQNFEVTVIDNLYYTQTSLINFTHNNKFNFIYGDVRDLSLLEKYIRDADVVIPLAAIVGFPACKKNPELAKQLNYEHIKNICKILGKNSKTKIIYPNTNSGYGIGKDGICTEESPLNPISLYGKTKVDAEKEILKIGGISLRLATVFGASPRMRMDLLVNEFVFKALTDGYITIFEKDFVRNYIHIRDVASAFLFMIKNYEENRGEVFNVGLSNANLTKQELVEKIKEYIPNLTITYSEINNDPDKRNYTVSNSKIESLGFKPKYSIEYGIKELIKTYKILIPEISSKFRNALPLGYLDKI